MARQQQSAQEEALDALLERQVQDESQSRYNLMVGRVSSLLARTIGLPIEIAAEIGLAARLREIGLSCLPPAIVHAQTPRRDTEEEIYRTHPIKGAELLMLYSDDFFAKAADICLYAQEKIDGSGWPKGVRGRFIPLEAKIVSVAVAYVDLRVGKSGNASLDHKSALEALTCGDEIHQPEQFDDQVLWSLVEAGDKLESIIPQYTL